MVNNVAVLIRAAVPADLAACVAALGVVHEADGYPVRWPADPGAWLSASPALGAWVAVRGAEVVGHVVLVAAPDTVPASLAAAGGGRAIAYVARLFVVPSARGQGLARRLLDTAADAARAAGLAPALDVVDDGVAAIRLYERAGWRRLGSARAEWRMANGEPALVHYYLAP
jgi:GNAT superfamily N-acetyltransferase